MYEVNIEVKKDLENLQNQIRCLNNSIKIIKSSDEKTIDKINSDKNTKFNKPINSDETVSYLYNLCNKLLLKFFNDLEVEEEEFESFRLFSYNKLSNIELSIYDEFLNFMSNVPIEFILSSDTFDNYIVMYNELHLNYEIIEDEVSSLHSSLHDYNN